MRVPSLLSPSPQAPTRLPPLPPPPPPACLAAGGVPARAGARGGRRGRRVSWTGLGGVGGDRGGAGHHRQRGCARVPVGAGGPPPRARCSALLPLLPSAAAGAAAPLAPSACRGARSRADPPRRVRQSMGNPNCTACRARQAVKIAVAADAANLGGERVKFGAVEQRLTDILSGVASLSQVPDTVGGRGRECWGGCGGRWQARRTLHPRDVLFFGCPGSPAAPPPLLRWQHALQPPHPPHPPPSLQQAEEALLRPARARIVLRERRRRPGRTGKKDTHYQVGRAWARARLPLPCLCLVLGLALLCAGAGTDWPHSPSPALRWDSPGCPCPCPALLRIKEQPGQAGVACVPPRLLVSRHAPPRAATAPAPCLRCTCVQVLFDGHREEDGAW